MLVCREGSRPLLAIVWLHEIARGVEDAAPDAPSNAHILRADIESAPTATKNFGPFDHL